MKKRILPIVLAGFMALGMCGCGGKNTLDQEVDFIVDVEAGRDAVILQLTDIQIIDAAQQRYEGRLHSWSAEKWQPENMEDLAFKYMRQIVNRVKPDLIVLSGDNVYGEFDDAGTSLQRLVAEIESYEIPWTLTFGNHDNETHKGIEWTSAQYENAEHCLFTRGPIETVEGNGNFTVGIRQGGKITEVLWLMDSNGHTDSDADQNMFSRAGLYEGQIEWFTQTAEKMKKANGGKSPKSIGFFHHPMRAFGDGLQQYGYVSSRNDFYTPDGDYGVFKPVLIPADNKNGDCGNMNLDCGFIDSDYTFHNLLKKYNCEGWFFGHEHRNNASVKHEGVRYTFGLKASLYDDYQNGEIGGTKILVGNKGLRVNHEYYREEE